MLVPPQPRSSHHATAQVPHFENKICNSIAIGARFQASRIQTNGPYLSNHQVINLKLVVKITACMQTHLRLLHRLVLFSCKDFSGT